MLIGGEMKFASGNSHTFSKITFWLNLNEDLDGEWIHGPDLIEGRENHAAEIVTDQITGEDFVVVSGGVIKDGKPLRSVEILMDKEWKSGTFFLKEFCFQFLEYNE